MNKKIMLGIIVGLVLGSVSVYAGTKFYASDVAVSTPTGSNLGSNATLQDSLDELYSIADKYDELNKKINSLKSDMLDEMYPVGSIYFSTSITTASDISKKFGGTWEAYGTGKTLVGVDTSNTKFNTVSKTGGSSTTTLTTSNLPSHNHTYTPKGNISSSFSGNRSLTEGNGGHTHRIYGGEYDGYNYRLESGIGSYSSTAADSTHWGPWFGGGYSAKDNVYTDNPGNHQHYYTPSGKVTSTFTGTTLSTTACTNCSGTSFSVQNPYITVYMYKRIK